MKKKKMSGRLITAIVLLIAGVISTILGFMGGHDMEPYEAREGIVMVRTTVQNSEGNWVAGHGTGWAVGKPGKPVQYIVTNGHVVQRVKEDTTNTGELRVYFSEAENDYVEGQIVYYSAPEEKDLAVIKLPSATNKRTALTLRNSNSVKMGETAYALGYPGDSSDMQQFPTFDMDDVTITKGVISNRVTPKGRGYDAFQMDVSIAGGNSGGPLVDEKGNVIGINTLGKIDPETGAAVGMNYAITVNELAKILRSEGIPYTMNSGSGWAQPWFGYVFLPIGILALLGGVVLLIMERKRGAGAAFAGGAAAGAGRGAYGGARGVRGRAVLRGVAGKYAGQSFELSGNRLVIGRDPGACNIVFDKNTPGISGRHCQISYDQNGDCFWLVDLGSSYGTFLGSGKKLTAGQAEKISAGETFYLCDAANQFAVIKE